MNRRTFLGTSILIPAAAKLQVVEVARASEVRADSYIQELERCIASYFDNPAILTGLEGRVGRRVWVRRPVSLMRFRKIPIEIDQEKDFSFLLTDDVRDHISEMGKALAMYIKRGKPDAFYVPVETVSISYSERLDGEVFRGMIVSGRDAELVGKERRIRQERYDYSEYQKMKLYREETEAEWRRLKKKFNENNPD